jgi:hypothetical protein
MSIAAVEQRLSALLEELESGLRRSRIMEPASEEYAVEAGPPVDAGVEHPEAEAIETAGFTAEARAAAVIVFCLTVVAAWSLLTGPTPSSPSAEAPTRMAAAVAGKDSSPMASTTQPALRLGGGKDVDAAPARSKVDADAAPDSGGLSVDQFNQEVERLLAKSRGEPHPRANDSDPWLDGPLVPEDAPSAMERVLPLPPPPSSIAAAEAPAAEPNTEASAPAAAPLEAVGAAEAIEKIRAQPAPIVKAKARTAKPKRAKAASKPAEAPQPAAAPAQTGPASFIQGATAAITGVMRDWGKMTSGARR